MEWLLIALLGVFVLLLAWAVVVQRAGPGIRSRARNARAQAGEQAAEALLLHAGFEIVDRQVHRHWTMEVDGEPVEVALRVDFLVARDGVPYVAEVKTGGLVTDPTFPATRRQLMEYGWVFGDHGLLLVDVEAGWVHEVAFPVT